MFCKRQILDFHVLQKFVLTDVVASFCICFASRVAIVFSSNMYLKNAQYLNMLKLFACDTLKLNRLKKHIEQKMILRDFYKDCWC